MTYRLCLIFAALCFISNYLLRASGAGTHVYDADKATEQSKTSSRESFGKKKEETQQLSLFEGHKTPMRKLISRRKRYYEIKAERNSILAKPDDSKEKQALIAKIEHEKSVRRNANKRRYRRLQFAVRTDSATPHEQSIWDARLKTKAYRSSSPSHEEKYQRHLQHKNEKAKENRESEENRKGDSPSLQKRGEPRSFDLNVEAEEIGQEEVQSQANMQPAQEVPLKINRSKVKKYIPVSMLTEEQRNKVNARKRMEYQQQKLKQKEALTDPSKMTPKIRKQIERRKANKTAATHRYINKLKRLSATGEITKKQENTLGMYYRTKTWREASPTNMSLYKGKCKRDYALVLKKKQNSKQFDKHTERRN